MCFFELQLMNLDEELVLKDQAVRISSMASKFSLKDSFQWYMTLCMYFCLCAAKQSNKINALNYKKKVLKTPYISNKYK